MSEAGIEVPEFRCPTTPETLASTSFCATVVPTLGSAWSSSATSVNLTSLPPILMPAALASSTARRAPFSLSLPRCAIPPVSGPTWPILTSLAPEAAPPPADFSDFGASLLQPASASAMASSETASEVFFIEFSEGAFGGAYLTSAPPRKSIALLLRQDPLHQRLDVGVGHLGVGRHRHLAPDALPALLHLFEELGLGSRVTAVLRRHFLVGRTDQLLVGGMAGEAIVLFRQFLLGIGGQRRRCGEGEEQCGPFHGFSLHAAFNCMRSLIGERQVTPRHSQPLTGSGRLGLSSGAGSPVWPSARARTTPSGRYSRANSSCQRPSSAPRPRRTSTLGGESCSDSAIAMAAKPAG